MGWGSKVLLHVVPVAIDTFDSTVQPEEPVSEPAKADAFDLGVPPQAIYAPGPRGPETEDRWEVYIPMTLLEQEYRLER